MVRGNTKGAGKVTRNSQHQLSHPETDVAKVAAPVVSLQPPAPTSNAVPQMPVSGSSVSRPRRPGLSDRHIVEINPELRPSTQAEKAQVAQAKRDAKAAREKEEAEKEEALRKKLEDNCRQLAELMDAKARRMQQEKEGVEEPEEAEVEPKDGEMMEVDTDENRSQVCIQVAPIITYIPRS